MANFWTKIYALWRQPTQRTNLNFDKYLPYFDGNDNFPLKWHKAISDSPSATSCVSTIQDFLEGAGFSDETLENRVVNSKGETFFQVHQKTSKDFGEFEGFYWLLRFNALGQVTEIELLPFENCRLGPPDSNAYISKILYNPFFGTADFKGIKANTIWYDCYNPKAVKEQIQNQKDHFRGQVLFVGTTNALSRFYPMPEATAAMKWMQVETGVADYHDDNINNGFLQPFMLLMKGDPNAPSSNPEYTSTNPEERITVAQEFDEVVSNNFMGAKRVGNMWVHWVQNPEEKPEVLAMPSNNSGDLFLAVDTQATKKITIAFKVPAILANINEGVSLGGDGNTVKVSVKLMQQRSIKKQRVLTDTYSKVLKQMDKPYAEQVVITPYNPYPDLEVVDDKIWDAMTLEERREWISKNTDIVLFEDDTLDEPVVQPRPAVSNAVPIDIPDNIKNTVKKALDYQEKMGLNCGGKAGRQVAKDIIDNKSLGFRQITRIYNYLKKRPEYANSALNEGCEVILYNQWGVRQWKHS